MFSFSSIVTIRGLLLVFFTLGATSVSFAQDVADYGQLPNLRSVSISPNGKLIAYIVSANGDDTFVVRDLETMEMVGGANASKVKARDIFFATNDHVIIKSSTTASSIRVRGKWEQGGAMIFNLKTDKLYFTMRDVKDLYLAQGGLGRIVGLNVEEEMALMPAYVGTNNSPTLDLIKVNLNTGRGRRYERGKSHTVDWFVNQNGDALARVDFDNTANEHRFYSKIDGKWKQIFSEKTDRPLFRPSAITADGKNLVYSAFADKGSALHYMSLDDGAITGPFHQEADKDIDGVLKLDRNRTFGGVVYSGLLPLYMYSDSTTNALLDTVQAHFAGSLVRLTSMTRAQDKGIVFVSGPQAADAYYLYTANPPSLKPIGTGYPNVKSEDIADVKALRYKARDGLPIYAVVTWPVGVTKENRKNLPLLVFPHGGPEAYDRIEFDWWAQYFARQGYVVMQPNFRGSTGSGQAFRDAGRGKWGREMQDDITDGVNAMIKAGHADADRVCIMGASYGGYAALAGGAFTPDLYRCVISVAGVSDVTRMLKSERRDHGRRHWVVSYWEELIGDLREEREKLKDISPANFADAFTAPVLLIHGRDDTVVPLSQSKVMAKALKKANKPVELVMLKGEDHWLSTSDTRLKLLEEIDAFLRIYNPAN